MFVVVVVIWWEDVGGVGVFVWIFYCCRDVDCFVFVVGVGGGGIVFV